MIMKGYAMFGLKNRKRVFVLAAAMMLAAASFGGCGKKEDKGGKGEEDTEQALIDVGFSQLGAESDYRVANTESIRNALTKQSGFNLSFDDAQQKQDKQLLAIRKFTQQEVDCIVLAPVMETGDFRKEADIACEWLKAYTEAKGIAPEELNIVDIQGTLGATAQIDRSNGLSNACRRYGWNLYAQVPADYTQAKAKEVMTNLLEEYDNINVVYCENDNEAVGAIEAIEESGRKAGLNIRNGEILIISFDAAHSGLSLVLEGKIALDVECNPLQGDDIARLIKAIKNGEEFPKYTYVPEQAFSLDKTVDSVTLEDGEHEITHLTEDIYSKREY